MGPVEFGCALPRLVDFHAQAVGPVGLDAEEVVVAVQLHFLRAAVVHHALHAGVVFRLAGAFMVRAVGEGAAVAAAGNRGRHVEAVPGGGAAVAA